ncbi:unnamed protein product [Phytomonas sp. EM1]|nr:unnamed protein product [Phytomonas sp. EM1]|eukprot:CCW65065.1 unnamed protein product [Phytomonas sp. isolate EM1]
MIYSQGIFLSCGHVGKYRMWRSRKLTEGNLLGIDLPFFF